MKTDSIKTFLTPLMVILALSTLVCSHCQIPCGIYNDQLRIDMLGEHITTIEKSITSINELSQGNPMDMNQIVRWVNNKDSHCDQFSEIVTYYFMAQRIKPVTKDATDDYDTYILQLSSLHRMMVLSMKAKQDASIDTIEPLRDELKTFAKLYFAEEEESNHGHKH